MKKPLGRNIITGVGWTFSSAVTVRAMQFLVTVVLARLLAPSAFGLFALGTMIITAITLFRDLGLGQSLIYHKTDVQKNAETTFLMSAVFGLLSWGAVFVASPLLAKLFGGPDLIWPLRVMSFSVVLTSLATVPSVLLEKELEFKKRALPEFAMGISYAAAALILAVKGFGVWSLVGGHLAMSAASLIVTWLVAGWKPAASFHRESAKKTLNFGKHLMAASVLFLAFFYIDHAAIGRWLGVTALGYYSIAFTICNLPATNITHVVNKVMYPTYSKLNEDMAALRKAYTRTVKSIAMLSFPIACWLFMASEDFVLGFFGPKWSPAIPLFKILALYGMFRSIGATAGSVFMAVGEPKWVYRLNFLQIAIAAPLVYPVAIKFGTIGVATLFTVAYTTGTSLALWKVVQILEMTVWEYFKMFQSSFIASVATVIGSFLVAALILPSGVTTAIGSAILALVAYPITAIALDKESYRAARSMLSPSANQVYATASEGKVASE
ncbi:MAG TPA: lipopolysaccharide biosynthesis protein [Armatimonadota bacterium]|nr:lipopolysaccharide biosynthesis protein [Armatimonadota bacterium]